MKRARALARTAIQAIAQRGFRRDAALLLIAAIISIVIIMGIVTPILITRHVVANEIEQGQQVAASFAQGNTTALLLHASENGKEPAERALSFPSVRYVAVYDDTNTLVRSDGTISESWRPNPLTPWSSTNAVLAHETDDHWHFVAPVYATTAESKTSFARTNPSAEYLGYVHLVRSKTSINQLSTYLLSTNALLAIAAALVSLGVFVPMMNRLLRSIVNLSNTLEQATNHPVPLQVSEQGPTEIAKMVRAFNKLMADLADREQQLREHSNILQGEVERATEKYRKAHDAAVAANKNKSEFLSIVSHEFRTPLQNIVSYTELVARELRLLNYLTLVRDMEFVLESSDQLKRLLDNVLDLEKLEDGCMEVLLAPVNMAELCRTIVASLALDTQRQNNQIVVNVQERERPFVTDRGMVRQMILNLLTNANKFTRNGTITLRIRFSEDHVLIEVTDTGPGIAKKDQDRIFEKFRQAREGVDHPSGTGLGLYIVMRFAALLDGSVDVESDVGKGAMFIVRLPTNR